MKDIKLHNTLSGKTELFTPIHSNEVYMYHCGPTVYNYLHIGNLRAYLLADTLRRTFEINGYKVKQVINITDVGHLTASNDEGLGDNGEDKMEKMAKEVGKTAQEISEYYTQIFFNDIKDLNIKTDETLFPKASEHIKEQIEIIKELEAKGFTYKTSDGIYFDTAKFPEYGKLGNINIEGLIEGARVTMSSEKRNGTDFALWKFSHPNEKRFQEWESPWGVGFPGWHIECSAMSEKYLGKTFDIHTGGIDHIPVHHNNEIAQSEGANGVPLAHYWLHGAFVNIPDGKMSKSKGNFVRLQTLRDSGVSPLEYRYWLLGAHYSSQVQFTFEAVEAAGVGYKKLLAQITNLGTKIGTVSASHTESLLEAINNNLDTPKALSLLWDLMKDTSLSHEDKKATVFEFDKVLGLNLESESDKLIVHSIPEDIQKMLDDRKIARDAKDWKTSDELRDKMQELGFTVMDTESGQVIHHRMQ
jgi:cysteinyl-tRNA synthetase